MKKLSPVSKRIWDVLLGMQLKITLCCSVRFGTISVTWRPAVAVTVKSLRQLKFSSFLKVKAIHLLISRAPAFLLTFLCLTASKTSNLQHELHWLVRPYWLRLVVTVTLTLLFSTSAQKVRSTSQSYWCVKVFMYNVLIKRLREKLSAEGSVKRGGNSRIRAADQNEAHMSIMRTKLRLLFILL